MMDPRNKFTIFLDWIDQTTKRVGVFAFLLIGILQALQVEISEGDFDNLEVIAIDIVGKVKFRLVTINRATSAGLCEQSSMTSLCDYLSKCSSVDYPVLLVGDVNCNSINWEILIAKGSPAQRLFFDTFMNLGFTQLVQDPTRGDNILDVILRNHPFLIANIEVCECFSTSDHSMVKFALNVDSESMVNSCFDSKEKGRKFN